MNTYEMILTHKLVAIVRGFTPEDVVEMAKAYIAGGVCCMEVTFDQASAENGRKHFWPSGPSRQLWATESASVQVQL